MNFIKHIINILSLLTGIFLFYCLVFIEMSNGREMWVGLCGFVLILIPLYHYNFRRIY